MLRRDLFAGLSLLVPLANPWQEKGKGRAREQTGKTAAGVAVAILTAQDREILREWARSFGPDLPPGLAKRAGDLPPGLEKQLVRKGRLPPGLEKRIVPIPFEIERRLAPLRSGLVRGAIAGRIIVYNPSTRVIFDVFFPLD